MRAGGMQAEDARTPLADGTLVKTPSAPMPPAPMPPRRSASTGVSTQRCRYSPSLSPIATVTANPSHNLVRRHRNKNTRTRTLESQTISSHINKNETISTALKSIHGSQPRGH